MANLLSKSDIEKVVRELIQLTGHVEQIQQRGPPFDVFQLPKTPTALTESIVYHLIKNRKILGHHNFSKLLYNQKATAHKGTRKMPTDLIGVANSKEILIEVKGTRLPAQFTQFGDKDVEADCVVWVDYGQAFLGNSPRVEVAILEHPKSAGLKPKKYNWTSPSFTTLNPVIIPFPSISAMLN